MMRDVFEVLVVVFFAFCFVAAISITPLHFFGKYQCKTYQEHAGRETKWTALTCYITDNGRTIPYDEHKMRAITNEKGE